MLTAESGRENVAYIAKLGVRDYLVKAFQDAQLIEKVQRVIPFQAKAAAVAA
jgi:two-component system cell cycle response regulator